ncbi:unnamed protein product [Mytilus edulis]|uniref:Uncharacterized protein n=1 Tax=Mytilus edulis TaxID=6550 RepID=A0A8S3UTP3_MYTED|nr:unnamed protein product [Mytilus edulis]
MAEGRRIEYQDLCGICKSVYTTPRLLDCCHVFCSPCIAKLIENGQIFRCPLCRREMPKPEGGVDGFSLFPFIEKRNDESNTEKERTCEMCDETEVHSRCEDCDQNMCKNCHDYHLKNTTFKKHKIVDDKNKEVFKDERISKDIQCDKHTKELSLYCKSCNLPICEECQTSDHACHKTENLDIVIKAMKSTLKTSMISLKSKIPFLDNIVENAKSEENKYWKDIRQMQAEVRSVASSLKELICKSVDIVMFENLDILESFSRVDKKTIETYVEEAELNRLSNIRLITAIEATINYGYSKEIVRLCSTLGTDTRMYNEEYSGSELKLHRPIFKPGTFSYNQIHDSFGIIERESNIKVLLKPQFPCLQIRRVPNYRHFTKKSSFQSNTGITCTSMMATGDSHVCVTNMQTRQNYGYTGTINIFDMNGKSKQLLTPNISGIRFNIIGMSKGQIFFWDNNKIDCIQMQTEEKFGTTIDSWENDIQGLSPEGRACIMNNGNMLVLLKDKFYEVEATGKTVRTFNCNENSQMTDFQANCILYTKTKMILVGYNHKILAITLSGDLRYSHTFKGSSVNSMCNDRHGNVFVADSNNHGILMLTSDGHFIRNVLTSEKDGLTFPLYVALDGRGNLWIQTSQYNNNNNIEVFSYL